MRNRTFSLHSIVFIAISAIAILVIITRRLELLMIMALPMTLLGIYAYGATVLISTWAVVVFLSGIPVAFLEFKHFSYVVYFCMFASLCGFLARAASPKNQFLSRKVWLLGLLVIPVTIGAVRGLPHLPEIPGHMLRAWTEVPLDARAYIRTFYFVPMYMPILAVFIAGAVARGLSPMRLFRPAIALNLFFGALVVASVVATGLNLGDLADYADSSRADFIAEEGGLHPNVYGLYCTMVYAFLLGSYNIQKNRRAKLLTIISMSVAAAVTFLTFSRSAVIAFALVNILHFWKTALPRKMAFIALFSCAFALLPSEMFNRFLLGIDTGDVDRFSSGRVEYIWLPLLTDVFDNILFGQGHYSIYWTNAQRASEIYPVTHSHNALIDSLLDYGLLGTVSILAFYWTLWRKLLAHSHSDPSKSLRGFFYGGHLAMVVLLMNSLNGRLTPEISHLPLWIAVGILLGRISKLDTRSNSAVEHSANPLRGNT